MNEDSQSIPMLVKILKADPSWFLISTVSQEFPQQVERMENEPDKIPEWVKLLKQAVLESEVNENQARKDKLDKI